MKHTNLDTSSTTPLDRTSAERAFGATGRACDSSALPQSNLNHDLSASVLERYGTVSSRAVYVSCAVRDVRSIWHEPFEGTGHLVIGEVDT